MRECEERALLSSLEPLEEKAKSRLRVRDSAKVYCPPYHVIDRSMQRAGPHEPRSQARRRHSSCAGERRHLKGRETRFGRNVHLPRVQGAQRMAYSTPSKPNPIPVALAEDPNACCFCTTSCPRRYARTLSKPISRRTPPRLIIVPSPKLYRR